MFSKFERSAAPASNTVGPTSLPGPTVLLTDRKAGSGASGERGNAAVVALCVTTLAVGVVMVFRLLSGSGSSNPTAPIAAANIGAGESDAGPSGTGRASSGPISSAASSRAVAVRASTGGDVAVASSPVPTLPGSVPTIPPDGVVPVAAPVPIVAVTPTTTPLIILGLKTPQAASRNLFDAWKENDRARALRFASGAAVDVVFRQAWGAEVQDDGCSATSNPTSFHCAFVGDEVALVVVVDQRIGPSGREFVPTRTIRTATKNTSGLSYAPPTPDVLDPSGAAVAGLTSPTTIDPLAGDEPLVDPAGTPDLTDPAIQDPSLLDPAGAAAALAESTRDDAAGLVPGDGASGAGASGASGASGAAGAKAANPPAVKVPKKKKSKVRRPKSAVSSSSQSSASSDAVGSSGASGSGDATKTTKKAATEQPASQGSGAGASEPVVPAGGAVKAGAPPVNQVDG
jgi:hypothetical protein